MRTGTRDGVLPHFFCRALLDHPHASHITDFQGYLPLKTFSIKYFMTLTPGVVAFLTPMIYD